MQAGSEIKNEKGEVTKTVDLFNAKDPYWQALKTLSIDEASQDCATCVTVFNRQREEAKDTKGLESAINNLKFVSQSKQLAKHRELLAEIQ